ncbi:MAG: tyrosine-type recombinase/integrase [Clostridia bacterium]|nr:tyrosine-type recombinase/integrase [Clostridia bacterium]
MTITLALNEFLNMQKLRYNSDNTLNAYRWQLSPFIQYTGDPDTGNLTLDLCNNYKLYLRGLELSSVTCQTYCRALRVFLKWLYEERLIPDNIAARFTLPKAKRKIIDTLSDVEIRRLYECDFQSDSIKLRNGCLVTLMLDSGIRLSEAVTLQSANVNLDDGYVIVDGKGNKQRIVPLGQFSRRFMQMYRDQTPILDSFFLSRNLEPITVNTVKDMFRRLKKESGVDRIRPHLLRHTFATRYLQNGGDLFKLQRILGHTSLEMTKRYLHLSSKYVCVDFDDFSTLGKLMLK